MYSEIRKIKRTDGNRYEFPVELHFLTAIVFVFVTLHSHKHECNELSHFSLIHQTVYSVNKITENMCEDVHV